VSTPYGKKIVSSPCLLDHITLVNINSGAKYKAGCDSEGIELSGGTTELTNEANCRIYYCNNCNKTFDGSETFEEVVKHLGTFPTTH